MNVRPNECETRVVHGSDGPAGRVGSRICRILAGRVGGRVGPRVGSGWVRLFVGNRGLGRVNVSPGRVQEK